MTAVGRLVDDEEVDCGAVDDGALADGERQL